MNLYDIASSPWWIVACVIAWLAIYIDWTRPTNRRMAIAFAIAFTLGCGLYAAEVPLYDYCQMMKDQGYPSWELWFLGCF